MSASTTPPMLPNPALVPATPPPDDSFFDGLLPWRTKQFFSPTEISTWLGVTPAHVRDMITEGRLPAHDFGGGKTRPTYRIPRSSLLMLLAQTYSRAHYNPDDFTALLHDSIRRLAPAIRRDLVAFIQSLPSN